MHRNISVAPTSSVSTPSFCSPCHSLFSPQRMVAEEFEQYVLQYAEEYGLQSPTSHGSTFKKVISLPF